jgi:hypothetical protein
MSLSKMFVRFFVRKGGTNDAVRPVLSNHKHSKSSGGYDWGKVIVDGESQKGRATLCLLDGQWTAPSLSEPRVRQGKNGHCVC